MFSARARACAPAALRMLACALASTVATAQEQDSPPVVEGPPDADVTLDGVERALDLLVAGDAAWKEGRRDVAFDAWRDAIVASRAPDATWGGGTVVAPPPGPGDDPDGTLARRAEDCAHSVRRRIALVPEADRAAWTARFEPLAEIERAAAGGSAPQLARVEREFPRTRAAARAALALCDLAFERGDSAAAQAWCIRATEHAGPADRELAAALAKRAPPAIPPERPGSAPASIELRRVVELGPAADARDAAIPGVALASDESGVTWFRGGGRLLRFDAAGEATGALDVLATLRARDATAARAFSEPGAPWDEAFALGSGVIALVEGRAREAGGNALVGVDPVGAPRVRWIRDSDGLVRGGERVAAPDLAGAPALLEFQPAPLFAGDTLVVHVRAWPHAADGPVELDEARVESWCAGLDPRDGTVRWSRRIATGSTARGLDRGRMSPAEPTALPALPPLALEGRVALDTGLGAIALLDAVDGRVAWIVRTSRRGSRPAPAGGIVAASDRDPIAFAPAAADGALLRLLPGPDLDGRGLFAAAPLVLRTARIPVAVGAGRWTILAPGSRGAFLATQDLATGAEVRCVELPFAAFERGAIAAALASDSWIAAAGGRAYLIDARLVLRAEVEAGPRARFARTAIAVARGYGSGAAAGRAVRIAAPDRIAFLAVH